MNPSDNGLKKEKSVQSIDFNKNHKTKKRFILGEAIEEHGVKLKSRFYNTYILYSLGATSLRSSLPSFALTRRVQGCIGREWRVI